MEATLRDGLAALGLPSPAAPQLLDFARRLLEKNQVMNLTAITEPKDVAALHLLDCAALLTMADFRGKSVVDVGTGAGFPGMVLRILEPDFDLTLLDSLGKRVDWLRETCDDMALPLVKVGGCFLAMKSVDSDAEIDSARGAIGQLGGKIEAIRDYTIPGTDVTHRVVIIRKVKDTPPQFPRSWARMKKAPLK